MTAPNRRLAAILAADIADYSTHAAQDEARMLDELRLLRRDILAPSVEVHHGRIVKSMGDGWLIEFSSAAEAVGCGIDIQKKIGGRELIKLRMGIHVGDIVHEDDDIYGDGVNISARLQQIAQPGGIILSDSARRSIDGTFGAEFAPLGARTLKHIPSAIAIHGWRGGAPGEAPELHRKAWGDAETLIAALAATGDRDAFAELVRRRQSWLRNLMRRACGDAALADDLAQEAFLKAWRGIGQLKRPERFNGWLRKLAVNTWLGHLRRNDALKDASELDDLAQDVPEHASKPAVELAMDLDSALAQLPAMVRLAVVLAYHEGMSHGEIAEAAGMPLGTVKSHVRRGAARLRQLLADYAMHPEQTDER
ncbi:MAG: sigma-70 family RNA polymerase sigma factor [Salaquimonas sp.]|nr:sigma-70 family RNA polymerase sigma factor [Salaquimonas sp.]